ncbi:MAG: glycosyltransferase family 39 protein [Bacteroidia bacterium]|nr:glycosyltransferase family 39 protein [Bacteroidia bacterium]
MSNTQKKIKLSEKNWFFPTLLGLLWLLVILIINPIGEFPINDDWSYSKNVFELCVKHKFYVDEWPAMTLISQTLYGSAFVKVFGFSFTVLRTSTLLLAFFSTQVLYRILKKKCGEPLYAFLLTAAFCFSQIFCTLSFTFMTDIFFLSFVIFSLHQLILYLDNKKTKHYILFIFFSFIAVLNRQHGLLLPLLIILPLLWKNKLSLKKIALAALPFIVCFLAHYTYGFLLRKFQIPNGIQGMDRLVDTIKNPDYTLLYLRAGDLFTGTGWILIPCSLLLLRRTFGAHTKNILLFLIAAVVCLCICWSDLKIYPWGNVWSAYGIGPKILKDYWANIFPRFNFPDWIKWTIRISSLISIAIIITNSFKNKSKFFEDPNINRGFFLSAHLFLLVYLFFSMLNPAYLDRYILPPALFFLIVSTPSSEMLKGSSRFTFTFFVAGLCILGVLQVKDFMNWNRIRWQALADLNKKGVNEHFIDGGFEYNAWYKPGDRLANEFEEKSWYWVDKDDYIIANGNHAGYFVNAIYPYRHYIPFTTDTIFILERENKSTSPKEIQKKKILDIEKQIRSDKNWLSGVEKQAKENKISLDSMIQISAIWMLNNVAATNKPITEKELKEKKIRECEDQIRNNKIWLKANEKQAKENNIPLDSMIRINATLMFEDADKTPK